jgi:hypothetical protein
LSPISSTSAAYCASNSSSASPITLTVTVLLVYLAVAVTLISGADYFFGFRALINARPASARQ